MPHPFSHGGGKRPATGNIILGMMLTLSGIVALIIAFIPMALRTVVAMYPADAMQAADSVDPRAWYAIGGVLLVGLGAGSVLRPRGYRALLRGSRTAQTVVFYDFENQSISPPVADDFIAFLRQHAGRQADLHFFADISNTVDIGYRKIYTILRRHGFHQEDVAHTDHIGAIRNIKNMVDMKLALMALERGLVAATPQHFIFITADLIYIPLFYRLRALGHQVSLWARDVPDIYQRIAPDAGITIVPLGDRFTRGSKPYPTDSRPYPNRDTRPAPRDSKPYPRNSRPQPGRNSKPRSTDASDDTS
jgi:hypothetical protein